MDIDNIKSLFRDLELVGDFLYGTSAKLVGDEVHIKITELANIIRDLEGSEIVETHGEK